MAAGKKAAILIWSSHEKNNSERIDFSCIPYFF